MKLNKKGFTLVELLAVVVILGIIMTVSIPMVSRWINRSKGESMEAQKQTLLLAGQSYAQGNSKVLPKAIGETKFIKAEDLKKANYLKEDLVNSGDDDILVCNCCTSYKACSACGCAVYSAWSGFSTFSKTVCTANDYTRCFTQIQYE